MSRCSRKRSQYRHGIERNLSFTARQNGTASRSDVSFSVGHLTMSIAILSKASCTLAAHESFTRRTDVHVRKARMMPSPRLLAPPIFICECSSGWKTRILPIPSDIE